MAQIAKTEAKVEITSPPEKVYDFFKNNLNNFVHLFPQVFKSAKLIEGEEGQVGNVKVLEYVLGKYFTNYVYEYIYSGGSRKLEWGPTSQLSFIYIYVGSVSVRIEHCIGNRNLEPTFC